MLQVQVIGKNLKTTTSNGDLVKWGLEIKWLKPKIYVNYLLAYALWSNTLDEEKWDSEKLKNQDNENALVI